MSEDKQNMMAADDSRSLGDMSIEDALARLDEIAVILESAQTGLKESLDVYSEGVQLINRCRNYLCDVEKEMITLAGNEGE